MPSSPRRPGKPREDLSLPKTLEFMRLLWSLDHSLQSASKRMESTLGITGPQRLVIRFVGLHPGISAGALATALHLDPSTLTGILRRLERRGLITRRDDPNDGRRALFSLTASGATANEQRTGTVEGIVRRAIARMDESHLTSTREALGRILAELEREERESSAAPAAASRSKRGRR